MTMIKKVKLDTLVTVVDGGAFLRLFGGDTDVSTNVDLAVAPGDVEGLRALEAEGSGMRKITEVRSGGVTNSLLVVVVVCSGGSGRTAGSGSRRQRHAKDHRGRKWWSYQ